MVRDIMLNLPERDLSLVDNSNSKEPIFDSVWGNLFDEDASNDLLLCNIIIPEVYWPSIKYNEGEFLCNFQAAYCPDTRNFKIRLVGLKDGKYSLFHNIRGDFGLPVYSYALSPNIATPIEASMLPYVNIDGRFLIRFVQNSLSDVLDKAYIYSAGKTDLEINYSDDQASQLLSLCGPGNYYRYPRTGVGLVRYLNAVVEHTDLQEVLQEQFDLDNKPITEADFDNQTGQLDVLFKPEQEQSDSNLLGMDDLNVGFFEKFTDDFVRRNTVLNEVVDTDFITSLDNYEKILEILIFIDETTQRTRVDERVVEGRFDGEGNIISDSEYFIVSATLEPNTVIMFDDKLEDEITDAPIFIINDNDETRLYTSLVEQLYWLTETCHKCMVLKKRSTIKYMIKKTQFQSEKGLYIIPQTSDNIKNMLGLVQDSVTGRLLGLVSSNTNISDMTLDEVTQFIYATHLSA